MGICVLIKPPVDGGGGKAGQRIYQVGDADGREFPVPDRGVGAVIAEFIPVLFGIPVRRSSDHLLK